MELDIVRAWKDAQYRQSLSAEQQAMLPENPAGNFELSESELDAVNGGSLGALGAGGLFGAPQHHDEDDGVHISRQFTGTSVTPQANLLSLVGGLLAVPSVTGSLALTCLAPF